MWIAELLTESQLSKLKPQIQMKNVIYTRDKAPWIWSQSYESIFALEWFPPSKYNFLTRLTL